MSVNSFFFFIWMFSCPFVEKALFAIVLLSLPFVKDQLALFSWVYFSISSSPPLVYVSVPSPVPHCLWLYKKSWSQVVSSNVLHRQCCIGCSGSLVSMKNLPSVFCQSQITCCDFDIHGKCFLGFFFSFYLPPFLKKATFEESARLFPFLAKARTFFYWPRSGTHRRLRLGPQRPLCGCQLHTDGTGLMVYHWSTVNILKH